MSGFEGKPKEVKDNFSNPKALKAMGTKGGINAALFEADRKQRANEDLEKRMESLNYVVDEDGDVKPRSDSGNSETSKF